MKPRIAQRVMVAVGVVSLAVFGSSAWLASRAHERELASLVERQALILSDTIRNSTRHAMLLNERDMVHRIIEQIGRQDGLEKIRVYTRRARSSTRQTPPSSARRSISTTRPATAVTATAPPLRSSRRAAAHASSAPRAAIGSSASSRRFPTSPSAPTPDATLIRRSSRCSGFSTSPFRSPRSIPR